MPQKVSASKTAAFDEKAAIVVKEDLTHVATNPGLTAITVPADVRDEESIILIISERVKAFVRPGYAVSCADIGLEKAIGDTETHKTVIGNDNGAAMQLIFA